MSLNRERITLNPTEESLNNSPIELGGDRWGHGIFIQPQGSQWPIAAETPQLAQSVDTEGGLVIGSTVGLKTITLKIQVVEPVDGGGTNYMPIAQPQPGITGVFSLNIPGAPVIVAQPTYDLVGADYSYFFPFPAGSLGSSAIVSAPYIPTPNTPYTAGVWLKGALGGEQVTLELLEKTGVTTTSTASVALTLSSNWQWYTVTQLGWTTGNNASIQIVAVTNNAFSVYGGPAGIVMGASFTEYFDGSFPGCSWTGSANNSVSTRPTTGGPRLESIMADLENVVKQISLNRAGTIRRVVPTSTGTNTRITYDVVNAQITWDDTSMMNAGVVKGTITLLTEPYGRGPEITTIIDNYAYGFLGPSPNSYVTDSGALTNFQSTNISATGVGVIEAISPGTENRLIYTGTEYPLYTGEVSAVFYVNAVSLTAGWKGGIILKRVSPTDYLEAYVTDNGTTSTLKIDEVINGTRSSLASVNLVSRLPTQTPVIIRARVQLENDGADHVYAEYFTGLYDPSNFGSGSAIAPTSTPVTTATATLPTTYTYPGGGASYPLSSLTPGYCGLVLNASDVNVDYVTSLRISPYLARERTLPVITFGLPGIPGSAPALGRMVVQDDSGHDQYWVQWGLYHRRTDEFTDASLFYEAEALTPLGGATVTASAGASGGSAVTTSVTMVTPLLSAMLSTNISGTALAHHGDFVVMARMNATGPGGVSTALAWSIGDFESWTQNSLQACPSGGTYNIVNLGTIHIPKATTGPQQWQGRILVAGAVGCTAEIDCIWLVPVSDTSGTIQGVIHTVPNAWTAHDEFNQVSATMNGATLPVGGTWATSGAATDFTIDTTNHLAKRTATDTISGDLFTSGRLALATGSTLSGVEASVDFELASIGSNFAAGLILRYVNATNYVIVAADTGAGQVVIDTVIAGSSSVIGQFTVPTLIINTWYTLQAIIDSDGRYVVFLQSQNGAITQIGAGQNNALAASGALASGECGIFNFGNGGQASFDNWWCISYTTDSAFFAGKQLEVRSDRAKRQDSAGTIWTSPSSYIGNYLKIPTPETPNSVANFLIKSSRNDVATMPDTGIDPIEVQVNITPRYGQIPNL